MSLVKIGTLLLVSAVVACVLFVVVVLATSSPEPDAPFSALQVLGTLLLIYWLGAAVAGAILLLVNLFSSGSGEISFSGFRPRFDRRAEGRNDPGRGDRPPTGGTATETSSRTGDRPRSEVGSVRASVFCSKCGAQNRRGERFCNSCENPLPV